ncbi:MAG: excinuclease ABC subunit UvrB [Methanomicrobiales archaeon]|nr:excinuclease ABC subunit UvrB [Methanomicrobiales archaeon]
MTGFTLRSSFSPKGSQPGAIQQLVEGLKAGLPVQTLLGVTGSGKTFTIANVIEACGLPTLVIAHNKTLAAQLYHEFQEFFPDNRVEYFVSYYDYYQPESYIPQRDQYIEKDAQVNPHIERMRLSTTASLATRDDVVVIASVSCIYGLGNPENFRNLGFELRTHQAVSREQILRRLIDIQYERNEVELLPGRFRVRGDVIDLVPGYHQNIVRIEMFGDKIERIREIERTSGRPVRDVPYYYVYPARHFVIPESTLLRAVESIRGELALRLPELGPLEAHRLEQRTLYDLEMIEETGSCKGIENYSRHFDFREPGEKPYCLLDYFPSDFLMVIDESHQTIPQLHGMHRGDRSRKQALIEYGFRLPSAYDNRPLTFQEFSRYMRHTIFVSATPGEYELSHSGGVVEQVVRPTGLLEPHVEVRPLEGQTSDVIREIEKTVQRGDRALVTTLTKRLAEELAEYLSRQGVKTRYLHSEIDTIERTEIIRQLRLGRFDVLVGINLLREGLDIPEVGFIGILDADKEGFLRDERSLIQTIGRAARNLNARVILYGNQMTGSMRRALDEVARRRSIQEEYNHEHAITPLPIIKPVREKEVDLKDIKHVPRNEVPNLIIELEAKMRSAAEALDFERAIALRDTIRNLQKKMEIC